MYNDNQIFIYIYKFLYHNLVYTQMKKLWNSKLINKIKKN